MPILGIIASSISGNLYAGSAFESIATTTLSSNQTSVTLSTIPGTYKHLQLRILARTDRAADDKDSLNMRFNSDSANNYSTKTLSSNGSSVVGANTTTNSSVQGLIMTSATAAAANTFGYTVVDIFDYANSNKNKTVFTLTGVLLAQLNTGTWQSTNAITSITFTPNVGTNIISGSRFALYGIKG